VVLSEGGVPGIYFAAPRGVLKRGENPEEKREAELLSKF